MTPYRDRPKVQTFVDSVYAMSYKEKPVGIVKFLKEDYYLGGLTDHGNTLYPVWIDALEQIFSDDKNILIVLTGAIGTGKSTVAILAIAYVMYRLLLLKLPWNFFNLQASGKMGITFFNLTKSLGESRGFSKLQSFLLGSPWFQKYATRIVGGQNPSVEFSLFQYILSSPYSAGFGSLGEDVVSGVMDEVDTPIVSIKQKRRVLQAYESTYRRFESRFVVDGRTLGRLFIVASKQDQLSFVETFIAEKRALGKVLIFDIALWEAKPKSYFSGVTFKMAVPGDAYHLPKIVSEMEDSNLYLQEGYSILEVPVEFKTDFVDDPIGALRDIAGKTVSGIRKYKLFKSEKFIVDCFKLDKLDPVKKQTIYLGLKDEDELIWYLDLDKIRLDKRVPRYVHMDYGVTGDALGLAMSGIAEWIHKDVEQTDGTFVKNKVPVIETDFVFRLKAKEGDSIPTFKVRKLILDLRSLGYVIKKFTADLKLASEDTFQVLKKAGIETGYMSVDRTDKAYVDWRNLIYERRWNFHKHDYVLLEAKNLELDSETGKVDHPDKFMDIEFVEQGGVKEVVMEGSKDLTDAIAGSVQSCLLDTSTPIDMAGIRQVLGKVKGILKDDEGPGIVMRDSAGKEIMGVQQGGKIEQIKNLIRKVNRL